MFIVLLIRNGNKLKNLKLKITKEKTLYKISDVSKINLEDRMFFPISH